MHGYLAKQYKTNKLYIYNLLWPCVVACFWWSLSCPKCMAKNGYLVGFVIGGKQVNDTCKALRQDKQNKPRKKFKQNHKL